jgi:hypothetical protein
LRYLLMSCIDRSAEPDEVEEQVRGNIEAWVEMADARDVRVLGGPLAAPSTATTVRVRDGETLLTDGPFAETKEFLAGIDILSCETMEEALELAASNPLARIHTLEVRPFWEG